MNQPIQPNELRIGNGLIYTGSEDGPMRCIIDAEDIRICEGDVDRFNEVHKPIAINHELLVEVGFTKVIGYFITTKPNISLELAENNDNSTNQWYCYVRNINGIGVQDDFCLLRKDLRHLHQLQNLIFALTGVELTINTK